MTMTTSGYEGNVDMTWDFGDGSAPLVDPGPWANPRVEHRYNLPGIWNACLTWSNPGGSSTSCQNVYIAPNPAVPPSDFWAGPANEEPDGLDWMFGYYYGGVPANLEWDFDGDGIVDSTAEEATFTYAAPGVYTVTLTASNENGSNTSSQTITVGPTP